MFGSYIIRNLPAEHRTHPITRAAPDTDFAGYPAAGYPANETGYTARYRI